ASGGAAGAEAKPSPGGGGAETGLPSREGGVYVQPAGRSAALDGDLPRLGGLDLRQVQRQHAVLQLRPDAAGVHLLADPERPEEVAGLVLPQPRLAAGAGLAPAGVQRQLAVL